MLPTDKGTVDDEDDAREETGLGFFQTPVSSSSRTVVKNMSRNGAAVPTATSRRQGPHANNNSNSINSTKTEIAISGPARPFQISGTEPRGGGSHKLGGKSRQPGFGKRSAGGGDGEQSENVGGKGDQVEFHVEFELHEEDEQEENEEEEESGGVRGGVMGRKAKRLLRKKQRKRNKNLLQKKVNRGSGDAAQGAVGKPSTPSTASKPRSGAKRGERYGFGRIP